MPACLIGLGSNARDRRANLDAVVAALRGLPNVAIVAQSVWRETPAVGGPAGQSAFLNGAILVESSLAPRELLAALQAIENRMGRVRAERWGPRTLDLDLLLYGDAVIASDALVVPHPRMAWRRFVLEPAEEIAAAMLHPTIGWTIARLLQHLNTAPRYVAITGPIAAGKSQLAARLTRAIGAQLMAEELDWSRLDAFYTDPAAEAWATETAFVHERARLLAADVWSNSPDYPKARGSWTVSDFWFDQSAAFAHAWLPPDRQAAFAEEFSRLRRAVVRPRLLVVLDAPTDELLARIANRGRPCEQGLTARQLEAIRLAVLAQTSGPDIGPVLRANSADAESVFVETLAAMRGME